MYAYMDSANDWFSAFFFSILVVIGSFFLLNLFLAVIMSTFTEVDEELKEKERLKKQREEEVKQELERNQAILREAKVSI